MCASRVHAWALFHRRLALPDHAARRGGRRARSRKPNGRIVDLPGRGRGGDCRAAAARRRPARLSISRSSSIARRISTESLAVDAAARRCAVEPGIVLDELNRALKPSGLWFPVDISTASRATIGGMVGNNSCGARSLRYGNTRENVIFDRRQARRRHARPISARFGRYRRTDVAAARCVARSLRHRSRARREIETALSEVQRRVGGYNLDAHRARLKKRHQSRASFGRLQGTLAFSTKIELKLSPLLGRRVVGACHFGSFHAAMVGGAAYVEAGPIAVELIDRTMLGLASRHRHVQADRGMPSCAAIRRRSCSSNLPRIMPRLRLLESAWRTPSATRPVVWNNSGAQWGGVVEVLDPGCRPPSPRCAPPGSTS